MNVLAVDVGGNHVKILVTGQESSRRFDSGPTMIPDQMVAGVKKLAEDWSFDKALDRLPGPGPSWPSCV